MEIGLRDPTPHAGRTEPESGGDFLRALSRMLAGDYAGADARLAELYRRDNENIWYSIAFAENLEHLGREDLSHAALQREAAVTAARPRRGAASLRCEIEQAARSVTKLCEEKAASISEMRVVRPELVAVVAKGQRGVQVPVEGFESRKRALPLFGRERFEADFCGGAIVAEPEETFRKTRRGDDETTTIYITNKNNRL